MSVEDEDRAVAGPMNGLVGEQARFVGAEVMEYVEDFFVGVPLMETNVGEDLAVVDCGGVGRQRRQLLVRAAMYLLF